MNYRELPEFRCPHEKSGLPTELILPDYHPITPIELIELMLVAQNSQDFLLRATIQSRLTRAIPGMTCPRPYNDPVSKIMTRMDILYLDELYSGPTSSFMPKFFELINLAQSAQSI